MAGGLPNSSRRHQSKPETIQRYAYKKSPPHAILKSFADDLKLIGVQPRTQDAYFACVRQLAEFYGKSPDLISTEELRQYFIHLKCDKKVARQTSTQALCAIKLFWEKALRRPWPASIECARSCAKSRCSLGPAEIRVRNLFFCEPVWPNIHAFTYAAAVLHV